MIFLSHAHADKPIIEPIAVRLAGIFGQQSVFYDSWSIQPGDGIIEKINNGLKNQQFVFYFVSSASLKSKMVDLEWQNALYKSTKGTCRIIPIRIDDCSMPDVLLQSLYIDLYSIGIESALVQIVNVIQGNNTFIPQHRKFSNLTWRADGNPSSEVVITISASHLMEPNPDFWLLSPCTDNQMSVSIFGASGCFSGFTKDATLTNGMVTNVFSIKPMGGAITPSIPLKILVQARGGEMIQISSVLHRTSFDLYTLLPQTR